MADDIDLSEVEGAIARLRDRAMLGRKGFGSRVIDGLISQLGGKLITSDNKSRLRTVITIPFLKPKRFA